MQFRGPTMKGSKTSWASDLKIGSRSSSGSQRSGMKDSGSVKLVGEWNADFWGMPARYYHPHMGQSEEEVTFFKTDFE